MQEHDNRPQWRELAAEEADAIPYAEIERAEFERQESAKNTLFWAVGVPFGGMAAGVIAFGMRLDFVDFLCVWMICAAAIYMVLSPAVK